MADNQTDNTDKKSLGIIFQNFDKTSPKSYDLKGTVNIDGTKYRIGGYKSEAKGTGKLKAGTPYFWLHRVEKLELLPDGSNKPFDPAAVE